MVVRLAGDWQIRLEWGLGLGRALGVSWARDGGFEGGRRRCGGSGSGYQRSGVRLKVLGDSH